ncbi:MAG: hypothetical protein ABI824_17465, partial [Acidobacteriota bacterium]
PRLSEGRPEQLEGMFPKTGSRNGFTSTTEWPVMKVMNRLRDWIPRSNLPLGIAVVREIEPLGEDQASCTDTEAKAIRDLPRLPTNRLAPLSGGLTY